MSIRAREASVNCNNDPAWRPGDANIDENNLLSLFRNSYGDNYLGDGLFLQNYIHRADKVTSLDEGGELKAAALMRASRLTAIATDPSRREPGYRQRLMVNLLRLTQLVQPDGWITIHDTATKMQQTAELAGMAPLQNKEHIRERLHRFGELAIHTVAASPNGLIVTRTGSHHGADYIQHAWGWQD